MDELIKSIFADMQIVSKAANPNNYKTSGKITFKKFLDNYCPGNTPDEIYDFTDFMEFRDQYTFEEFEELYNSKEELNFWVYDRYKDGTFIMYTLYGDKDSKFGTFEFLVDEIYNF